MSLGYSAIGQSFGAAATVNAAEVSLVPGTHTYVAPNTSLALPLAEVDDGQEAQAISIDAANWKSLGGVTIMLVCTMTCVSLFCCLGRADFTMPIFIFGYYVWCVQSEWHPTALWRISDGKSVQEVYAETSSLRFATSKTIRGVQVWMVMMIGGAIIDAIWICMAFAAWTCALHSAPTDPQTGEEVKPYQPLHCFDPKKHKTLISTYNLNISVLRLSILNLILMVIAVALSAVWVRQQKSATRTAKLMKPPSLY